MIASHVQLNIAFDKTVTIDVSMTHVMHRPSCKPKKSKMVLRKSSITICLRTKKETAEKESIEVDNEIDCDLDFVPS